MSNTMTPLHNRDVNTTGPSSRASNASAASQGLPKPRLLGMADPDMLASAPGVMSMLKSSTELGADTLMMPKSRFSAQKRHSNRQSGTASRLSTGSNRSQQSRPASGQHGHHAWPSISSGGRRMSGTSNYSNIAAAQHYLDNMPPPPSLSNLSDPASLPPPAPFYRDNGRSMSLTSYVHQHGSLANYRSLSSLRSHEPYPRPRSPYRYPTRLRRPGYRPASPAMSDVPMSRAHHRPSSGLRMAHGAHGSQGSFRGGPFMPPSVRPQQMYHGPRDRSSPSMNSFGPLDYGSGIYPPSLTVSRQGTPSIPDHGGLMMTPTNRIVLHSTPQSSDPSSSTPPTPANHPGVSISEPTIMQTGHISTRHGSTASATMPTYYDYSEQFEAATKESVALGTLTSPPTLGFVHRIRTILEERRSPSKSVDDDIAVVANASAVGTSEPGEEVHELPASPVINRITRDLIRSNLAPTSDVDCSVTPTTNANENFRSTVAGASSDAPATSTADVVDHARACSASKGAVNAPAESNTGTVTASVSALLCSGPSEPTEDGNTMSDFLSNYGEDDRHMTTVIEEPTEPGTIAMAEVEVAAPTPTQPRWKPSFDTPPDMLRMQSVVMASSVYSSNSGPSSSSRYSSPIISTIWPPPPASFSNQPIDLPASKKPSLKLPEMNVEQDYIHQYVSNAGVAREKQDTYPSRPPSAGSRDSGLEALMLPPRPVSAAEMASKLEPSPALLRRPSATCRDSRQDQLAGQSKPPSAAERFSKQYQVILPPRIPTVPVRELTVDREAALSNPLSALLMEEVQSMDSTASPVSPLSELNVNRFDGFAASPVSPLLSPELAVTKRDSNVSSIWSYRKPVPRRPDSPASISTRASVREQEIPVHYGGDRESTTDLRFSALGFRPALRQLDNVKEEPNLETSTIDLRASTFKFPLPHRKSSLAHYEEFRLSRESKRKASIEHARVAAVFNGPSVDSAAVRGKEMSTPKTSPIHFPAGATPLSELRAIPSLHFSRTDLFSKLNEALDLSPDPPSDDFSGALPKSASEQESTGIMRLKYRSFFESLDNMASDPAVLPQPTTEAEKAPALKIKSLQSRKQVKLPKIQQWTTDDLVAEIDRLSIPSINGLTQRLSELLPSLRRYYGVEGDVMEQDETVKSALDEIRRLGAELMPELRESGSSIESDSDEMYESTSASSSPCHDNTGSTMKAKKRPRSASTPGNIPITPLAELDGTPAVPRARSMSHSEAGHKRDSVAGADPTRGCRQSLVGSAPESRPWNLDTSYPWADNVPLIDISLPAPTTRRDTIKLRPSRLRLRDDASETGGAITDLTAESRYSRITATVTTEHSFSRPVTHGRRTSKRSFLGSISQKIGGLSRDTSIDNSGYATGREILRGHDDRTVDPGDRYPTTGLSPPSALIIDEVRSFFSDNSSHFETQTISRGGGLRKRFSNLKTKLPPMSRTHSALEQRHVNAGPSLRRSNSFFFARGPPKSMTLTDFDNHIDEAAGMPKTEVRAKKLVNRMKTLWYRGGDLLRTLSGKRRPRDNQDWDDDDGESMVFPDD